MVVAMMLPASLPTIRDVGAALSALARPRRAGLIFAAAFAAVWVGFGLLAFTGDVLVHRLVDTIPWLASRPSLVDAGLLVVAGAFQFTPLKRRSLAACRQPRLEASTGRAVVHDAARLGLRDALACLGASWALMLLMFGEGFASLPWMVALTAVMAYETTGRHARRISSAIGAVLLLVALTVLLGSLLGAA